MATPSVRPLTLSHGSIETSLLLPTSVYFNASQLRDQFMKQLPTPTDNFNDLEEPASSAELLAKFLGYTSELIDPNSTGLFDDVLKIAFNEFETQYLKDNKEIHTLAAELLSDADSNTSLEKAKEVVRNYIKCKAVLNKPYVSKSGLLENKDTKVFAVFGGQGRNDHLEELRGIYELYQPLCSDLLTKLSIVLLELVADLDDDAKKNYSQGFDLLHWLETPESAPDADYLLSVNISCPLICVIQILNIAVTCRLTGESPKDLRSKLVGATGHSQGIITALALSQGDGSWESFYAEACNAIKALFFIGLRCIQAYPNHSLPPSIFQDSLENNEGKPAPMLSVRDLSVEQVQKFVDKTNSHLPEDSHISVSLINGARNVVVSGPPKSLYGLNLALRKAKAPEGLEQSRIPFSERKLTFSNRFLQVSTPFHSHLLTSANDFIIEDFAAHGVKFSSSKMTIPVIDFHSGKDLRNHDDVSLTAHVVKLITNLPVYWQTACDQIDITHILDFGPGASSGIGQLTHSNKEGTGVRVIFAGTLDVNNSEEPEFGFKQELLNASVKNVRFASNWLNEFGPSLVRNADDSLFIDTKMSRLLGRAPLMVPGMTPTTVDTGFVAATMNAGYHIEIAGGGYFEPNGFERALKEVASKVKPGSGIGINLIYVNPRMLQWGIPLIKKLREANFPIQSLTIGAGVPSLEVATEYIETLGLTHLGLKPGSIESIHSALHIAKAHPNFPIVLQWTGGRGGGHHSFEDFHQPILATYARIRSCKNVILVAGSGFGSSEDTYEYLTGEWSLRYNRAAMPFDGFLFGSRVMIAKETKLSLAGKKLVASCPGVDDKEWEQTYKNGAGGIITVRSEMGEPIHKVATRGVKFWAHMDKEYFALKPKDMVKKLNEKRDEIIEKLNKDFQRPWFGKNSKGVCEVSEMTYEEVSLRLIDFFFSKGDEKLGEEDCWIDGSLRNLLYQWLCRVEERFSVTEHISDIDSQALAKDPFAVVQSLTKAYPDITRQLVNAYDTNYFLKLCSNPAMKPVPFVPVLDERLETYFKKDSLFQCENLRFVLDRDIQRTCILHGPVATKYTTKVDEPIKDLMDGINQGLISKLLKDKYNGDASKVPSEEYVGGSDAEEVETTSVCPLLKKSVEGSTVVYEFADKFPKSSAKWFNLLAGNKKSWKHAILTSRYVVQGTDFVNNPIPVLMAPFANGKFEVLEDTITMKNKKSETLLVLKHDASHKIELLLFPPSGRDSDVSPLVLIYNYNPADGFAPILEETTTRNERIKKFYWKLWFGKADEYDDNFPLRQPVFGKPVKITQKQVSEFAHIVKNSNEYAKKFMPMDFAIVVGWERIMKSVFHRKIDGDLLKLVHLSNSFSMCSDKALEIGETVGSKSEVISIIITPTGKKVKVLGTIFRLNSEGKEAESVMQVTSEFFLRGNYKDYENTFDKIYEKPVKVSFKSLKDVAVLKSKEWAHLEKEIVKGQTLTFKLETELSFKNDKLYSKVATSGDILLELPTKEIEKVGTVDYVAGESFGNPVLDYLSRHGVSIEETKLFESPLAVVGPDVATVRSPASNVAYAQVSGDYNPIHVSPVFAKLANLPGTITHGMYTSAVVRQMVELYGADNVAERVRAFSANFTAMVLPNTELSLEMEHIGMVNGRKIIRTVVKNSESGETVVEGSAEIRQPVSTYLFTGQGSQEQNMGMDLYAKSAIAKEVWDRADKHLSQQYGFSILEIVRKNPKELTVHFGGVKGRAMRKNYTSMTFETMDNNGELRSEKIFKEINNKSKSYTFRSPSGLLSATQFTQPALTLMEKAAFEDMKSRGLVPENCVFAGHSLGEYSALASLGDVIPIESLVEVVFYRGMTMQVAVERDELGRSNYGMIACNPSRVSKTFDDAALKFVVEAVAKKTGWLLEIVNHNVENQQYVAAGDLRALDTLTNVLNLFKVKKLDIVKLQEQLSVEKLGEYLDEIVEEVSKKSLEKTQPIDLQRGFACIPLKGISVPFHSSYLRGGVQPFKKFLLKKIPQKALEVNNLTNKYIPNLTARPFEVTKEYFEEVYQLTGSERIKGVLENWEKYQ